MTLVAVGVSHHLAPVAVRERVHLDGPTVRSILRPLARHAGLCGLVCLSTCNRTEFYVSALDDERAGLAIERFRRYLVPGPEGQRLVHAARGGDALTHLFRVASGLDSMVLGESQILAQLKRAHRLAGEVRALDATLDLVMRRAVTTAKRVRTETGIGRRAVGIAQVAVEEAARRQDLRGSRVLVLGAGQVGSGAARLLQRAGAGTFWVVERGPRSRALGRALGGTVVARDALGALAGAVDVLVCATSQSAEAVGAEGVAALRAPGGRLLVLDLAVPRDVAPEARALAGVELVDLDDLGAAVRANLAARARSLPGADALIAAAVADAQAELEVRRAAPVIRRLVARTESLRRAELDRTLGRLEGVSESERAQWERCTRALAAKLIHPSIRYLRAHAADPARTAWAKEVLGLDHAEPG